MGDLMELENLGKKPQKHKSCHDCVRPVKIILVELKNADYKRKTWGSSVFTFVLLLMGAIVFTVLLFSMNFELPFVITVHIILGTVAFLLFMPMGIMMFSSLFGGSMYLNLSARKEQHLTLELSAVFFVVLGTLVVLGQMALTAHALTGLVAMGLAVLALVSGAWTYRSKNNGGRVRLGHIFLGVATLLTGNLCVIFGLLKESFIKWAPVNHLSTMLIFICCLVVIGSLVTIYLRVKYFL